MDRRSSRRLNKSKPKPKEYAFLNLPCTFEGCHRRAAGIHKDYCAVHSGGREHLCSVDGCDRRVDLGAKPAGYCYAHAPNKEATLARNREWQKRKRETCERWWRDQQLRDKWIDELAEEQGYLCKGFWTCEYVADGEATNLCPWGTREVPKWAMELDHKTRVADGGSDERANLQMLCACCHSGKSRLEAKGKRKEREGEGEGGGEEEA